MQIPYELALGWRYTRAGRATRRNGFISFISGVSMLGIALGVAALIIVLSVMNGFQKEVRDRMLSVVSHIEIFAPNGQALQDVDATMRQAKQHPEVIGVVCCQLTNDCRCAADEDSHFLAFASASSSSSVSYCSRGTASTGRLHSRSSRPKKPTVASGISAA
jgi:hypothetical protein